MMLENAARSFKAFALYLEDKNFTRLEIISKLRESAEDVEAQAVVVALRDLMGYDEPLDNV